MPLSLLVLCSYLGPMQWRALLLGAPVPQSPANLGRRGVEEVQERSWQQQKKSAPNVTSQIPTASNDNHSIPIEHQFI